MSLPLSTHYRICPHCENVSFAKEEALFCVWCGTKLFDQCPECSKPVLHAHGKFCYHCGARYASSLSGHDGIRDAGRNGSLVGVEQWSREQQRLFDAKFPPNESLVRNKF